MTAETPVPFQLRPATAEDQETIRTLIRQVHINPMALHWRNFTLAVDSKGEMIGCGQIKTHGDGSKELASIAVVPTWRKQGVARAIIETLVAAHRNGPDHALPLYLTCRAELGGFYQRFQFQVVDQPAQMPPYFRRISRLVHLFSQLNLLPGQLLVMRRDN